MPSSVDRPFAPRPVASPPVRLVNTALTMASPIQSMKIARNRVHQPALSVTAVAGMVVVVITYPLPTARSLGPGPDSSPYEDAKSPRRTFLWQAHRGASRLPHTQHSGRGYVSMLMFLKEDEG